MKWPKDKTTWYAVRDDRTLKSPEDDLLYFKVWEANAYGILEAVILSNLRYWIEEKQKENLQYQYHPMSPRKLEEVFQGAFSRNSIDRALKHLVKDRVLIPKAPEHANDPIAYRFACPEDETGGGSTENEVAHPRTATEGGPTENRVAQNQGRGPSENTPGPTEKIPGPSENEGGPTENEVAHPRTKVAQPRTTIPINNYLKGNSLKDCLEVRLKEDRFKTLSAGVSSQTHPDAAHSDSLLNASLGASDQSGHNPFVEPIADPPVTDSPSNSLPSLPAFNAFPEPIALTQASQTAPNSFPESIIGSFVTPSGTLPPPASNPFSEPIVGLTDYTGSSPVQPKSPQEYAEPASDPAFPTPKPAPYEPEKELWEEFLDPGIHHNCFRIMKLHADNREGLYDDLAGAVVVVARRLIDQTDPAQLYHLSKITTQFELNGELCKWFKPFFESVFDQELLTPEPQNQEWRDMFIEHGLCLLNMAFCNLKFGRSVHFGFRQPYDIELTVSSKLSPWINEQRAKNLAHLIEQRKLKFASPDSDKEADPNLSANEKMQVLLQSLQARNRIGKYVSGTFTEQVVEITHHTPILARTFFQLNPHFTVKDINKVLDACLTLPADYHEDEQDPQWHARRGYKISLLLNNLTQCATQLNMLSQLPAFTPIPVEEQDYEQRRH